MNKKKCCERCGGEYEYTITPCMSKLCTDCTNYLLGSRPKPNYAFWGKKK